MSTYISNLLPLVANLPIDATELETTIKTTIKRLEETNGGCEVLTWAGPYDIIVYQSGVFCLVNTMYAKHYTLLPNSNQFKEVNSSESAHKESEESPKLEILYAIARINDPKAESPKWEMEHGPVTSITSLRNVDPIEPDKHPYFIVELQTGLSPRPFLRWKNDVWTIVPDEKRDLLQKAVSS